MRDSIPFLIVAVLSLACPRAAVAAGPADTIPCSGNSWVRNDDSVTAKALARLAARMMIVADSANTAANVSEEGPDATPEFFTSAAEVAHRAAAFGPDHLPTLMTAADVTDRASTLGEGLVDTVLAKRAECYATRALNLATRRGEQTNVAKLRKLLESIRVDLEQTRRSNEAAKRHWRP